MKNIVSVIAMNKFCKIFNLFLLLIVSTTLQAQQLKVNALRYWTATDHTRMVFDVSGSASASHQLFVLDNPARLVIDFNDTKLLKSLLQPPANHALFSRVRSSVRNKNDLRVVVDLKQAISPKSFSLDPNNKYGYRLVIDSYPKNSKVLANSSKKRIATKTVKKSVNNKARAIVVAIDAGHGGVDPGALGSKGTKEKKVVLQIAKN